MWELTTLSGRYYHVMSERCKRRAMTARFLSHNYPIITMAGKKYKEAATLIDPKKTYSIAEAAALAKKTSKTKFDASVEIHANLSIDPKQGDQQVRGTVSLPHGTGQNKKVAVFVSAADKEKDAKDAGADIIGGEELIAQINTSGKADFDVAIATPDMMPKLAKIAKILGPKGLMPNPKTDTVGPNIKGMVADQKKGKVAFKNDDTGNIHVVIGKVSFDEIKLAENATVFMDALKRARPSSAKGNFLNRAVMTTTMGPAITLTV
jgi:large subunit ribosomal protein L1